MKHVFIIRHGETDNNKFHLLQGRGIDASINSKGQAQAQAVAEALEKFPITKVVTSSLIRTKETAQPLVDLKEPVVESYSDLDEMGFGKWEGTNFYDNKEEILALQQRWNEGEVNAEVPGGESPQQVYDRAAKKVVEVLENSDDEYIAFYVHGRLIRILLAGLLGIGLKNMQQIKHENGSINHLTWTKGGFEVVALNQVEHLESSSIQA